MGDENGKISLLKLSKSFYSLDDNENKKDKLINMFNRETNREKNIEQILKKKVMITPIDTEARQEKLVKERIKKIEAAYLPFVNSLMQKSEAPQIFFNKQSFRLQEEAKEEVKEQEKEEKAEDKKEEPQQDEAKDEDANKTEDQKEENVEGGMEDGEDEVKKTEEKEDKPEDKPEEEP